MRKTFASHDTGIPWAGIRALTREARRYAQNHFPVPSTKPVHSDVAMHKTETTKPVHSDDTAPSTSVRVIKEEPMGSRYAQDRDHQACS
jgi:hypothetical protein